MTNQTTNMIDQSPPDGPPADPGERIGWLVAALVEAGHKGGLSEERAGELWHRLFRHLSDLDPAQLNHVHDCLPICIYLTYRGVRITPDSGRPLWTLKVRKPRGVMFERSEGELVCVA